MVSKKEIDSRKQMLREIGYTAQQMQKDVDQHFVTAVGYKVSGHEAGVNYEIFIRARQELIAEYEARDGIVQEHL